MGLTPVGTGYLGSHIVKAATSAGHNVLSISRGGKPAHAQHHEQVTWVGADISKAEDWAEHLKECDAVVSCVGAFGSNEVLHVRDFSVQMWWKSPA